MGNYLSDFEDVREDQAVRLAAWLQRRTKLTGSQIGAWTGLNAPKVRQVLSAGECQSELSPVHQRMLTLAEIHRCEASPTARLEKRSAHFKMPGFAIQAPPQRLRSAQFHTVRPVELYFLSNTRNAWHSTRVHQYWPGAISARQATAEDRAEGMRTQGSKFYIERIPGLALQADGITLVAAEANRSFEHRRLGGVFDGPLTAGRVLDAYSTARDNTVLWLHVPGNWRFDAWSEKSAARWNSSRGRYWLTWDQHPGSAEITNELRDVFRRARRSIRRAAWSAVVTKPV